MKENNKLPVISSYAISLPCDWEESKNENKLELLQKLQFMEGQIKTAIKKVEENVLSSIDAPMMNENGVLESTAITSQGETVSSLFEWDQREVSNFNFEEAEQEGIITEVLYEKKPLTKENIKKELQAQFVPKEKIDKLFNIVERGEPKLKLKKIKQLY